MRPFCALNNTHQIIIITLQQILNLYHLSMSSHSEEEEAKYSDDQQQVIDQQEKNQESFLSQKNNQNIDQQPDRQIHDNTDNQPGQRDNLNEGKQNVQVFEEEPKTYQAQKGNQAVHQLPSEQQSDVQKSDSKDQHNLEPQIYAANQAIDINSQQQKVLEQQNNNIGTQKADGQLGEHESHNQNRTYNDGQIHDEHNEQTHNWHNQQGHRGENETGQHAPEQDGQGDVHGHIESEGQEDDRRQGKQQINEEVEDVKMQLRQQNRTQQNLIPDNGTGKENNFTQKPTQSTVPILPAKNQEIVIDDKQQISNKIPYSQTSQQKKQHQNGDQQHKKANQDSPATKVTEQQSSQKIQIGSRGQESRPLYEEDNLHGNDVGQSVISRRVLAASVREKPQKEQEMGKKGEVCSCTVM